MTSESALKQAAGSSHLQEEEDRPRAAVESQHVASIALAKATVRTLTKGMRNQPLRVLLHRLNWVLRGWTTYFRHRTSSATFDYLGAGGGLVASKAPADQLEGAAPPLPARVVADAGHRDDGQPCRGRDRPLPLPGRQDPHAMDQQPEGNDQVTPPELVESPLRGNAHGGFGGAGRRNGPSRKHDTALRPGLGGVEPPTSS
jgi:Group II intron, maturase-specific domain